MKKLLLTILFLTIFPLVIYAQEETTVEELLITQSSEIEELEKKEEERIQNIANLLGFTLPDYTDNPSYVITFSDPSPSKVGVEVQLDGKPFSKINSPYTFPALSIGQHTIKFRFNDKDDNVQILEYNLIVIPRTPIINSPTFDDTSITITGTALANSEIHYSLTANAYNEKDITQTDGNGNWSITITPEGGLSEDIYSFMAYTRKYGYASNLSEAIAFAVGDDVQVNNSNTKKGIYFSFSDLDGSNLISTFSTYPDLIILTVGSFLIGLIMATTIKTLIDRAKKDKRLDEAERILAKGEEKKEGKTLREMFESGKGTKRKKDDGAKVEVQKEPSIINKDVFLSKYRILDPDTPSGKEKDIEDTKKKIKVSLTSHED